MNTSNGFIPPDNIMLIDPSSSPKQFTSYSIKASSICSEVGKVLYSVSEQPNSFSTKIV